MGIKFVFPRSESLALKKPKTFPKEQRRVFRAPDLREILRVFNGEEWCRRASLMEGKWVGGSNFYVWIETAKPRHCANDVVIFMGGDRGLGSSCLLPVHYLTIAIPLIWKKIDFRADSIAYI